MTAPRRTLARAMMALSLSLAAVCAWLLHADAWDLGRRSPVLSYDAAQYAVAARELAEHGRLATPYALPLELSRHPRPPWPLALVQPGLVLAEAAVFRLVPGRMTLGGRDLWRGERPDQREWLVLLVPFACFLTLAVSLGLAVAHLLARHAPAVPDAARAAAGLAVGLAFVLDPEAQHFAVGGFTELPFTLGLTAALAGIALGRAERHPLVFGLLLGVTGLFRGVTLWVAPVLALAAAWGAPAGRRARVLALALLAWAAVLAPWWVYKAAAFGDPAWDLSRYSVWDGIEGRTWFSVFHTPEAPALPSGAEGAAAVAAKTARNVPHLLLMLTTGLGGLWLGALALLPAVARPPRAVTAAAVAVLAVTAVSVVTAAASVPQMRYLFPARMALAAGGLLALWALLARVAGAGPGRPTARLAFAGAAALALGWGAWSMSRGLVEARAASLERGLPATATLMQITVLMNRELAPGEPVMSNLGPTLAWTARRPVVHLALSPEGIDDVRRRLDVRHVLLVFRDAERAWPGWREVIERPLEAPHRPEWNVRRVRRYATGDGFTLTWLEMGPLEPGLARALR
jgi:hypothetical protein